MAIKTIKVTVYLEVMGFGDMENKDAGWRVARFLLGFGGVISISAISAIVDKEMGRVGIWFDRWEMIDIWAI
jgi:hypothetical protein